MHLPYLSYFFSLFFAARLFAQISLKQKWLLFGFVKRKNMWWDVSRDSTVVSFWCKSWLICVLYNVRDGLLHIRRAIIKKKSFPGCIDPLWLQCWLLLHGCHLSLSALFNYFYALYCEFAQGREVFLEKQFGLYLNKAGDFCCHSF